MTDSKTLYVDLTAATMTQNDEAYGLIPSAAIAIDSGRIAWVGPLDDLPGTYEGVARTRLGGRLVTPGLIDCHTHIVHGGDRAGEFEMRLNGASYEEVARAGGGIVSTVTATRAADEAALIASALPRVDTLLAEGICTLEIKSGYGLDVETELRMLRAAHEEGLVDAVDGFCEGIAFSPAQIARVFDVAQELGLPLKLHAEQLSNLGGAKMAASYGAMSADHIEYLDDEGVAAMADAGTVAVILPGAFYTIRETQAPPIESLRKHGVPMALSTDNNPGSSPLTSLLLTMNMACTLFRMTPEEALAGATRNAAAALGLDDCGTIAKGKRADLAVWDVKTPAELSYRIGFNPLHSRIFGGIS